MIDPKKEIIQQKAIEACLNNRNSLGLFKGTCEIATGHGKTFIAFKLIHKLKPESVLFLAEAEIREKNILEDYEKFKLLYNYDPFEGMTIEFACYQSAYKWKDRKFDFVVADEIHDSLSPAYFNFYLNNKYKHLLGLSATIDKKNKYEDADGNEYTKIDLLNRIAPVVFKYSLSDSIENKTGRNLRIIVIKHYLDHVKKTMPVTYKKNGEIKTFYQTEFEMYDYYNRKFYQTIFQRERNEFLIRHFATKRNAVLYKAPSKIKIVKELLKYLNRTIVFGNDIDSISEIVPTVSSRHKPATNIQIIKDFNEHKIDVIGSFKMLKQGVNLKDLDNVIMHSYYGVPKDSVQRIGRSLPIIPFNSVKPKSKDMAIPSQAGSDSGRV